ncbi:MAG: branched-chain amino acid ABC transporter permease [Oscillospiraceae bacterium]|nr:branched-chain amino acid ABC transporter permease [Oscillospiraceae bacterium]
MERFMILLITGLALGCIYGLVALGYSLIYKASGLMSLMQGDIMTLGAYLGLTFYAFMGIPFALSLVLTIAVAFLFGILMEKGIIRTLTRRGVGVAYIVLATIAISYIIQNGVNLIWGNIPLSFPSVFAVNTVRVAGVNIQPEVLVAVGVSLLLMIALHFFMTKTRVGTSMRAAAMDSKAAEACGIDTSLSTGITWGLSAGIAAVGGMLIGPMYGVFSLLGAQLGRKGFAGAVIGGFGNMYGAMVGGIALGLLENFVAGYISSQFRDLVAYMVLLLFLFIKPTGIFNERAIQDG